MNHMTDSSRATLHLALVELQKQEASIKYLLYLPTRYAPNRGNLEEMLERVARETAEVNLRLAEIDQKSVHCCDRG